MSILVLGGAGYIGSHMVDRLIEKGEENGLTAEILQGIRMTLRDKKILEWNGTSKNDPKQYYKISNEKQN